VAAQGDEENVVRGLSSGLFKIAAVTVVESSARKMVCALFVVPTATASTLRVSLKLRQYPTSTDASDARNVFTVRADFSIRAV